MRRFSRVGGGVMSARVGAAVVLMGYRPSGLGISYFFSYSALSRYREFAADRRPLSSRVLLPT